MINLSIVGRLGADPELRYTQAREAVCGMRVASTKKIGNEESTTWVKLNIWGKGAEAASKYFKKGDQIIAVGDGKLTSFKGKDGREFVTLECDVRTWEFGAKKKGLDGEPLNNLPQNVMPHDMDIPF